MMMVLCMYQFTELPQHIAKYISVIKDFILTLNCLIYEQKGCRRFFEWTNKSYLICAWHEHMHDMSKLFLLLGPKHCWSIIKTMSRCNQHINLKHEKLSYNCTVLKTTVNHRKLWFNADEICIFLKVDQSTSPYKNDNWQVHYSVDVSVG